MRKSITSLLPVLALAAWLPVQAQGTEQTRANASIAGKAAAAKAATANAPAKATAATAAADRKRQFTAGAVPAAAQSTSPAASPSTPALTKDKSHCHSSGSEA